jgi:hypothetical protein
MGTMGSGYFTDLEIIAADVVLKTRRDSQSGKKDERNREY